MLLYSAVTDTCRTRSPMPKPRAPKLETATARRRLDVRKKPYWTAISPGRRLPLQLETRAAASACLDPEQAGGDVGCDRANEMARQFTGQRARAEHRQPNKDRLARGARTRGEARPAHWQPASLESWPRRSAGQSSR